MKELLTLTSCRLGLKPAVKQETSVGRNGGGRVWIVGGGGMKRGHGSCPATAGSCGNVGMKSPFPGEVRASEKPQGFV